MKINSILIFSLLFSFAIQAQAPGTLEHKQAIASGNLAPAPFTTSTFPDNYVHFKTASSVTCQPEDEVLFIPIDSTIVEGIEWERIEFSDGTICTGNNGWTSDDCSSAEITIDFNYSLCGEIFNSVWVNTNGNITFDGPLDQYNPDGIPNNLAAMVAPFWADVDLATDCGEIWVYNSPTIFAATWLNVGYFGDNCDLQNTYQVIITDGNEPILGSNFNTGFFYQDMNWTTGDASGGLNGFPDPYYGYGGGSPAVVGMNSGEDNAFAVIGQFDAMGTVYDGPLGNNDGVDFLDDKFYLFNSDNCAIESSCSIFDLEVNPSACEGGTYDLIISFVPAGTGSNGYVVNFMEDVLGPFPYGAAGELTELVIPNLPGNGQTGISIEIFDIDDSACVTDCAYDAPPCQGCTTSAGVMPAGPVYVCDGAVAFSVTSGQVLDENDVLNYALHTSATSTPGDILAVNATGQFLIGDAAVGTSYYISAIAGNDNGDGTVDLSDGCLSVAAGTEVIFLTPIELSITEDCDTETGELSVIISPMGGFAAATGGSYNVVGTAIPGISIEFGTQSIVSLGSFDGQSYSYTCSDANGCSSTFTSGPTSCVKNPIELTSFTATPETQGNLIEWTTESEYENEYFQILFSENGIDFVEISRVEGAGTSLTSLDYHFFHTDAPLGLSYYKLVQHDFNGKSSHSNIVTAFQEEVSNDTWTVTLNNPVYSSLNVSLSTSATLQFNVFDISGRQILSQAIDEASFIELATGQLNNGVYLLEVSDGQRREVHKFIKH